MPNIGVKIDGVMLLTVLALGAGVYLYTKRGAVVASVDPTNQDNLINQAAEGLVGTDNLQTALTPAFRFYDWVTE